MTSETVYGDKNQNEKLRVCFDIEWLAILKKNNDLIPLQPHSEEDIVLLKPTDEDLNEIIRLLRKDGTAEEISPHQFAIPFFTKSTPGDPQQRKWLCKTLEMEDRLSSIEKAGLLLPQTIVSSVPDDEGLFFEDSFKRAKIV